MRAVEITKFGPPEVLKIVERPEPFPAAGEILIDVEAAGVNRPDIIQRYGKYPPPPGASDIPGLEVAGKVAALGVGVTGWSAGDPICALLAGGGYAERAAVPHEQCLPIPKGLTAIQAAGIPETFFTVWANVFQRGNNNKCGSYGPITSFDKNRTGNVWTGNIWDNGTTVPAAM